MKFSLWLFVCAFVQWPAMSVASSLYSRNATDMKCFEVSSIDRSTQCSFVRENCGSVRYQIGRADYLRFYYCSPLRNSSLGLVLGVILLCFVSLALTASDYLCPNLYTISKFLQLSDNLAGLTLLALGNGSPDVLSTFKALEVDASGLAVSELMGAALFILTVVVGVISWVRPFKVPRFHFSRDIAFYLAISLICLEILVRGNLTYWSSVLLFSTYIVYVAVVIFSHSVLWENVVRKANVSRLRSAYDENPASEIAETDIQEFTTDFEAHPSIESLGSSEFQEERDEFDAFLTAHPHSARDERALIETGPYGIKLLLKKLSKHTSDSPKVLSTVTSTSDIVSTPDNTQSIELTTVNDSQQVDITTDNAGTRDKSVWKLFLAPPDADTSLIAKAYHFLTTPTNVLLRLTTPNREQAIEHGHSLNYNAFNFNTTEASDSSDTTTRDYDYGLDMQLLKIQVVAMPTFVAITFFGHIAMVWAIVPFLVATFYAFSILIPHGADGIKSFTIEHRFWNYFGSFLGFIASLLWISIFATEIVAILKTISVIFAIDDDVLGATVFAIGNSVGDLVSNFIIARMGMPVMAFGACFGGPLLSISSLGLIAAIIMYRKGTKQIPIEFSKPLKFNCFSLILALVFLAINVPLNGWKFDKKIGTVLITIWVCSSILTVVSAL